jgi:purine-cytosine permease-like protein
VAENTPVPLNRIERVLAFMVAGIGGLSVLAIVAILIATVAGVDTSEGPWLPISVFPAIGLPITLVLIIVFAVVSVVRRRRIADGSQ